MELMRRPSNLVFRFPPKDTLYDFCSCLVILGMVSKKDSSPYMDEGVGFVTICDRFSISVICYLAVRYFCKDVINQ